MEIILICLQNFQKYIIDNINNLLDFSNYNITVITDEHLIDNFGIVKDKIKIVLTSNLTNFDFDNKSKLNKESNDGLWFQSSNRFFYLYDYIKKNNIKNCFHIENDVMIYTDLKNYMPNDNKVYVAMDSKNRCIPGIVFISSYKELEPLIKNYNNSRNDMHNLALFYNGNKDICDTFPIIKKNKNFNESEFLFKNYEKFNAVFDTAAIGQYIGGCHYGTIIPGFINETCLVKYNNYKFYWIMINNNYVPHIEIENEMIPVVNLHIHRKTLNKFMGKGPTENEIIKIK